MLQSFRKLLWLGVASLLALGVAANAARAQDANTDDLRSRIERLEKQNQELMNALKAVTPAPTVPGGVPGAPTTAPGGAPAVSKDDVQKIVGDYLKARDQTKAEAEAAAKADAEAKGHVVG